MEKIRKQLDFLIEIDKVKGILRQSLILQGERRENDAEHSWHMSLAAMTLREYYKEEVDMEKVLKMILIHDIVEIYAGD
ncbi:MAG: HD domain-containing protein, partial [Fusobacteriaceae bacterium]